MSRRCFAPRVGQHPLRVLARSDVLCHAAGRRAVACTASVPRASTACDEAQDADDGARDSGRPARRREQVAVPMSCTATVAAECDAIARRTLHVATAAAAAPTHAARRRK